jgi:hypothetical protein
LTAFDWSTYACIFDAVKIKENDLAQVYHFDNQCRHETVAHAIVNVESPIGTDGLRGSRTLLLLRILRETFNTVRRA